MVHFVSGAVCLIECLTATPDGKFETKRDPNSSYYQLILKNSYPQCARYIALNGQITQK